MNSPHKDQWRRALMFSLICTWINVWVNNHEAGDLIRHRGHYDVNVMLFADPVWPKSLAWPGGKIWRRLIWDNVHCAQSQLDWGIDLKCLQRERNKCNPGSFHRRTWVRKKGMIICVHFENLCLCVNANVTKMTSYALSWNWRQAISIHTDSTLTKV